MTDEEEYLYIPTKEYNGVIRHREIPKEYCFLRNGSNRRHIAKESDISEGGSYYFPRTVALCGREAKGPSELNNPPTIGGTCTDCIRNFNEIMRSAIYDEEAGEFYLPE